MMPGKQPLSDRELQQLAEFLAGLTNPEAAGSDGSECTCLYLVTGDGLTGVEYEFRAFVRDTEKAFHDLRESVGVTDRDWADAPEDVLQRVLLRMLG